MPLAGVQALVDAVRNTGATNLILLPAAEGEPARARQHRWEQRRRSGGTHGAQPDPAQPRHRRKEEGYLPTRAISASSRSSMVPRGSGSMTRQ